MSEHVTMTIDDARFEAGDRFRAMRQRALIAGVIGALGNNGLGTSGVCWRAKIYPVRVEVDGEIRLSAVVSGIHRAVLRGARVINISLGWAIPPKPIFRRLRPSGYSRREIRQTGFPI